MTGEMLRTILKLALKTPLKQPPGWLTQQVPWLTRQHARWCLDHTGECVPWDGERLATRELLERLHGLLEHRPVSIADGGRAQEACQ